MTGRAVRQAIKIARRSMTRATDETRSLHSMRYQPVDCNALVSSVELQQQVDDRNANQRDHGETNDAGQTHPAIGRMTM